MSDDFSDDSCSNELEQYRSRTKPILAYSMIAIALILLLALVFIQVPKENKDMLNFFLGAVCGFLASIYGFYFGNSEKGKVNDPKAS